MMRDLVIGVSGLLGAALVELRERVGLWHLAGAHVMDRPGLRAWGIDDGWL